MEVTPRGLFTGGDATTQGGENVGRIAFYDFNTVPAPGHGIETTITDPIEGRVEAGRRAVHGQRHRHGRPPASSAGSRSRSRTATRNRYLQDNLTTWRTANTINATPGDAERDVDAPGRCPLTDRRQPPHAASTAKTFGGNGSERHHARRPRRSRRSASTDQTPTTSVTGPSGSLIARPTFTMTGTATDDNGVNSSAYWFRDDQQPLPAGRRHRGRHLQHLPRHAGRRRRHERHLVVRGHPAARGRVAGQATADRHRRPVRPAQRDRDLDRRAPPRVAPTVTISAPAPMTPPTSVPALTVAPGRPADVLGHRHRRRGPQTSRSRCATAPRGRTSPPTAPGAST